MRDSTHGYELKRTNTTKGIFQQSRSVENGEIIPDEKTSNEQNEHALRTLTSLSVK